MYPSPLYNSDLYKQYQEHYPPTMDSKVTLKNNELWKKFHSIGTEMIITKSGRRMFPSLSIQVSNLDPNARYSIFLEMNPASNCRYKYANSTGWTPAGTEEAQSLQRVYEHPDSPATGEYWMSQSITFSKLKLTNTMSPPPGHLVLSSMHKYQPRIIIAQTMDSRTLPYLSYSSVTFPETEFIAVTAYQNEKVTQLKIDNNPFAKGFRKNGKAKSKRKREETDSESDDESTRSPPKIERLSPLNIEDDRLSSSSSHTPSSPEINLPSRSPQLVYPTFPVSHPYGMLSPQFIPYSYYPYPAAMPICCYPVNSVPHKTNPVQSMVKAPVVENTKRLTDFSIRTIMGCS